MKKNKSLKVRKPMPKPTRPFDAKRIKMYLKLLDAIRRGVSHDE